MNNMAKILVYGMGALGSVIAAYLSLKHEVYGVGRGWHIGKIKEKGFLKVNVVYKKSVFKAKLAGVATNLADLKQRNFDHIFITTKAFAVRDSLEDIIGNGTDFKSVVLLQNGYGVSEIASEIWGENDKTTVLRAVTYLGANIEKPGEVNHAGLGETKIGTVKGEKAEAVKICNYFNEVDLPCRTVRDIRIVEFEKLAVNAVINPITSILYVKNGYISESTDLKKLAEKILGEIRVIAEEIGLAVNLSTKTVMETARKTSENISSMLQDILKGRKTEIDYINGAIVKLGDKLGVETPVNETIYRLIKALEGSKNYRVK